MRYYDEQAHKTYDDENPFIGRFEAFHRYDDNDISPYIDAMFPDLAGRDIAAGVAISVNIDDDGFLYAWSGPMRSSRNGEAEWWMEDGELAFAAPDGSWIGEGRVYFPEPDDLDVIVMDGSLGELMFHRGEGDYSY